MMEGKSNITDHASPSTMELQTSRSLDTSAALKTAAAAPHSLAETDIKFPPAASNVEDINEALASLRLNERPTDSMFRSLSSIFQASQMHEGHINLSRGAHGHDLWTALRNAEELEKGGLRDLSSLEIVKSILDQMLRSSSQILAPALQILADASRDVSWREPFGESGMIDLALAAISSHGSVELKTQALRLIGNCCADTDENRARLIESHRLRKILDCTENSQLISIAIPALYNVCCDYEPAQKEVIEEGLFTSLIIGLENGWLDTSSPAFGYACRLLEFGSPHLDAAQSPKNTVEVLLRAATQPNLEVEDCAALVDLAIAHLQLEEFQQHMLSQDMLGVPLRFLIRSYFPQANLTGGRLPPLTVMPSSSREPNEEAELSRVRKGLIQSLSDVSALPEFRHKNASLHTPLIESVVTWLSASLPQIQLCSCILLGNLARSDDICEAMLTRLSIHRDAVNILRTSNDSLVIHAALGLLRNLALPRQNKEILGAAGLIEALTRFWGSDFMPQVSHAAASAARQLVIGNIQNVQRLLTPLSTDEESPAHSRTYLSLLLSLFEKSDELVVKMEIARTTASILRCIHSAEDPETETQTDILKKLYSLHRNVGLPLGAMVTQSRYPVVRSEGWFAMALMARNAEGAAIISSVVAEVEVFTALEAAIRENSVDPESSSAATPVTDPATPISPGQQVTSNEMNSKDRDNATILINELLQHRAVDLVSSIRRSAFEELLQERARSIG